MLTSAAIVGWSTTQLPAGYDQNNYGEQAGEGVKARLIVLVSAVRTLLRGESIPAPFQDLTYRVAVQLR